LEENNSIDKISVAIVDDSEFSIKVLKELLRQLEGRLELVFITTDAKEAIQRLPELNIDIVFLDIELPGMNGFEILEAIGEYSFKVVFTTAHENYALKAFKINAFDYLMKPLQMDALKQVVNRFVPEIQRRMAQKLIAKAGEVGLEENKVVEANGRLIIDTHGKTYFIDIAKIFYLKAERVYSKFYYEGKTIMVSKSTNYFEQFLIDKNFFRIHRSYLINLNQIKEVVKKENSSYFVRMNNDDELSLARHNKTDFFERMKLKVKN